MTVKISFPNRIYNWLLAVKEHGRKTSIGKLSGLSSQELRDLMHGADLRQKPEYAVHVFSLPNMVFIYKPPK